MAEVPWYLVLDDIGRRAEALKKKKTNADRIRAMTDEDLAVLLEGCICPKDPCPDIDRDTPTDKKRCTKCWLGWLKQEVE